MAAIIVDAQMILPTAPVIGRPVFFVVGALLSEVLGRLFTVLPNAPQWPLRFLRILEILFVALAIVGFVLTVVLRRV